MGSSLSGTAGSFLGRKPSLVFALFPYIIGWILVAFPFDLATFFAGRFLMGFGADLRTSIVQVYLGEIAHPSLRGMLASLPMTMMCLGTVISTGIASCLHWKTVALVFVFVPLFNLFLLFFVPESPAWLASKGRIEEAREVLESLHRDDVDEEMKGLQASLKGEGNTGKPKLRELLRWNYMKPVTITAAVTVLRQFTGVYVILFFTVDIFTTVGSSISPNLATIIVSLVQLLFQLTSGFLFDRVGRKKLSIFSSFCMAVSMAVCGGFYYFHAADSQAEVLSSSPMGWLPLACLSTFMLGFFSGISALGSLMISELLPAPVRDQAAGFLLCLNNVSMFLVVETFIYLQRLLALHGTFWLYSTASLVLGCFCIFYLPETKGVSLHEIQRIMTETRLASETDETENENA
ncbi:unnamed protein product [Darwinula stevensoni]|uniref:Major facilitator superfamily (MFS) profile domain-containing protein n=1 Tax=Darwinula stevensoni TaxID=69355 RepID=A0A7R8X1Z0_9CRUS|nr:unnamed protein product [Darwinula stevensoni]CAG0880622.1 unnamed protein product [Darwinula stevensoni]